MLSVCIYVGYNRKQPESNDGGTLIHKTIKMSSYSNSFDAAAVAVVVTIILYVYTIFDYIFFCCIRLLVCANSSTNTENGIDYTVNICCFFFGINYYRSAQLFVPTLRKYIYSIYRVRICTFIFSTYNFQIIRKFFRLFFFFLCTNFQYNL